MEAFVARHEVHVDYPFQFATHGNLLGGKTALKESDQNIKQFKNSQKRLIHVTSPYNIQTLSSKQIMIILKPIRQSYLDLTSNSHSLFTSKCVAARREN